MGEKFVVISDALQEQYGAAIQMLKNVMKSCPKDIWANKNDKPQFWQVVYHTMWGLDWYLADSEEERENFESKFGKEYSWELNTPSEKNLSRAKLFEYLTEIKMKAKRRCEKLSYDESILKPIYEWHGNSMFSSLLYNMRHVMLHVGALNLRLHSKGVKLKNWVRWKIL